MKGLRIQANPAVLQVWQGEAQNDHFQSQLVHFGEILSFIMGFKNQQPVPYLHVSCPLSFA